MMHTIEQQTMIRETLVEAFPFTVDKFPLSGPDGMQTPHYGLFRSDTSTNVGNAVGSGYTPHTLDDVATLTEAALAGFGSGNASPRMHCHWRDGHHVTIAPSDEHRQAIYGTKDNIFPRFIVSAGYGGTAFSASLGLYRDCCRNLAMLEPAGEHVSTKIRHTHSLRPRIAELVATFQRLAGKWSGIVDTARRLDDVEIELADFVSEVFPLANDASRRSNTNARNRTNAIARRIYRERQATDRPLGNLVHTTAWEAFNGVQGYVQHDMRRRGRPTDIDRAITALDDVAVTRAMQHALALAS